jgi:hypothetical protein
MTETETSALLAQVLELLAQAEAPSTFDFERALLSLGCGPAETELLVDYIPSACGRAFLREIGVMPSDTYQRPNKDGSWGSPRRFSEDPLWTSVETFVESLRTGSMRSRKKFSLAAQHSAELSVVNKAVTAGKALDDLRGSSVSTAFIAPLKYS